MIMPLETKEENETDQNDQKPETTSTGSTETDDSTEGNEGDAFDAASYEESFGLPADTLKGVENAEDALEKIREYTDETLTAGLLSDSIKGVADAADDADKGGASDDPPKKAGSKNPELDALRADLKEVKESLAYREKKDQQLQFEDINRRGYAEIDTWASPKYGTTKSRNFKQAKAVESLQDLVRTHILGYQAQGKLPPIVEKTLRQVRAHHDEDYKPKTAKKNSDAVLGSPGAVNRTKKGDDEPANIHEALMKNNF